MPKLNHTSHPGMDHPTIKTQIRSHIVSELKSKTSATRPSPLPGSREPPSLIATLPVQAAQRHPKQLNEVLRVNALQGLRTTVMTAKNMPAKGQGECRRPQVSS